MTGYADCSRLRVGRYPIGERPRDRQSLPSDRRFHLDARWLSCIQPFTKKWEQLLKAARRNAAQLADSAPHARFQLGELSDNLSEKNAGLAIADVRQRPQAHCMWTSST